MTFVSPNVNIRPGDSQKLILASKVSHYFEMNYVNTNNDKNKKNKHKNFLVFIYFKTFLYNSFYEQITKQSFN